MRRTSIAPAPIYTADIITTYLPDTRKLSAFISEGAAPADCWRQIGRMVRAVHEHGVDHPDLTAHNILLDARGSLFLVDFDNARVKPPGRGSARASSACSARCARSRSRRARISTPRAWAEVEAGYESRGAALSALEPASSGCAFKYRGSP